MKTYHNNMSNLQTDRWIEMQTENLYGQIDYITDSVGKETMIEYLEGIIEDLRKEAK